MQLIGLNCLIVLKNLINKLNPLGKTNNKKQGLTLFKLLNLNLNTYQKEKKNTQQNVSTPHILIEGKVGYLIMFKILSS